MAQAYSNDLRRKLLTAHQRGEGSLAQLAERFDVSLGWAKKISAAKRATGSMDRPAGRPRGRTSKLTPAVRQDLRSWIEEQPDLTLAEMQQRLAQRRIRVGLTRLWTVVRALGLWLEKSHSTRPSKIPPKGRCGGADGAKKRAGSIRRS